MDIMWIHFEHQYTWRMGKYSQKGSNIMKWNENIAQLDLKSDSSLRYSDWLLLHVNRICCNLLIEQDWLFEDHFPMMERPYGFTLKRTSRITHQSLLKKIAVYFSLLKKERKKYPAKNKTDNCLHNNISLTTGSLIE